MRSVYRSAEEARRAFDELAGLDERLHLLWDLCQRAAPPAPAAQFDDDAYDCDEFVSRDEPDDRWCAEDYFDRNVKPRLRALVGWDRPGAPHALHSTVAYETVHDLLLNHALHRPCRCCAGTDSDRLYRGEDSSLAHW